jgi:hypothetical protein
MTTYKQLSYLLKLINKTKKIIIVLLILVNSLSYIYYKNLKKEYQADIVITAMPNNTNTQSVDIFNIYESYFRDQRNLEEWIKLQKFNNLEVQIDKKEILGYEIYEGELITYNKIFFRNAVTMKRSIYLTVPGEDKLKLKNTFLYSKYIANLLNELDFMDEASEEITKKLKVILESLKINYDFDLSANDSQSNNEKLFLFLESLKDQIKILDMSEKLILKENDKLPIVKVSPPNSVYTKSANPYKIFFLTEVLCIILIVISLIYNDFKYSRRK